MLLIPLYRKIDWRRPPVVTILLILANLFIYFNVQGADGKREAEAVEYYLASPLPAIELGAFVEDLKARQRGAKAERVGKLLARGHEEGRAAALYAMHNDADFMQRLRAEQIVTPQHPAYPQWREARDHYEAMQRRVVANGYGFIPTEHRPATFFTHMFLHGSAEHVLGNMLFLFLIGFSVEAALGRAAFTALYILGGLGAVGLFGAIYPQSAIPLVGASGAIAGLMGLYTVLFGLRRISFFCFFFVYFNFFKGPAILLLPLWLANELYQLFLGGVSNVAYVAHIGGLMSGAALGFAAKRWLPSLNVEYLDSNEKEERQLVDLDTGMKLIAELKLEPARKIFEGLLKQNPNNTAVLRQLYALTKNKPDSAEYHEYAKRLFALPRNDESTQKLVQETFRDYMKHARPLRLTLEHYVALALRFARGGQLEDAEKIIGFLQRDAGAQAQLPACLLALAEGCRRGQRQDRYRHYLERLVAEHPRAPQAQEARHLLSVASAQRAPG